MRFSILHISDLHRDLSDEINNKGLLDFLQNDFARFDQKTPIIMEPSLSIVSGDLVYGVKPGATEATEELRRQYAQAEEFFVGLAERSFDGNRERIVILPGNHDVCYEDMMASGQKIRIPVERDKKDLLLLIFYAELSIKVVLARVMLLQDPRRPISEASSILCRNLQTLL